MLTQHGVSRPQTKHQSAPEHTPNLQQFIFPTESKAVLKSYRQISVTAQQWRVQWMSSRIASNLSLIGLMAAFSGLKSWLPLVGSTVYHGSIVKTWICNQS